MFERGDALAERAWSDLQQFETRCSARAMAVVLTEAVRDAELRSRRIPAPIERPSGALPAREAFVPQRERIKAKLRSPAGLVSLLATLANPSRWSRLRNPW
jgi:hypothetical protein